MPLGLRLAALVTAPLLVIGVVFGFRLSDLWLDRVDGGLFVEQMDEAARIDEAIEWLQAERDVTAQLLTLPPSERERLLARLDLARSSADRAIREAGLGDTALAVDPAETHEPPADGAASDPRAPVAASPLQPRSLVELRELVDQRRLPPADTVLLYSTVIHAYHNELNQAVTIEGADVPASEFVAYVSARASAEAFIQARAWGAVLIVADNVAAHEWLLLAALAQTEDLFLARARGAAPPGRPPPDAALDDRSAQRPDVLRRLVSSPRTSVDGVSPLAWFDETRPRVDAHRDTIAAHLEGLIEDAGASVARAQSEFIAIAAFAAALVVAVIAGAWWVSRSIARPLQRLAVAARDASRGQLADVDVPPSKDAIGEIGFAYAELNRYMHGVADAADEIARGDLSRGIEPRSPEDRLGTALQSMTRQLAGMVAASEQRSEALEQTVGALQETAARDSLTGLISRGRFVELVDAAIVAARERQDRFGVLFIDLDGFKPVNDEHGHDVGDELLRQVASRLLGSVRLDDVVARLGGDEFTILVTNGFDSIAAEAACAQIVSTIGAPYTVRGSQIEIRASVGFASYPEHGASVDTLLRAADQAMYAAKRAGGDGTRQAGPRHTRAA